MAKTDENKAIVGRWFTDFWGKNCNLGIVDEVAAPDMVLQYSLHEPRRGREDIKAFMTDFRKAFPDLNFWGTADLIAEGDYVVGRWEGGGTHTGPAFNDFLVGALPAAIHRAARSPLAFAIDDIANGLAAGGAAVAGWVADRALGRFMAPRPVAQGCRKKSSTA